MDRLTAELQTTRTAGGGPHQNKLRFSFDELQTADPI
jgi:hypothetical protein